MQSEYPTAYWPPWAAGAARGAEKAVVATPATLIATASTLRACRDVPRMTTSKPYTKTAAEV